MFTDICTDAHTVCVQAADWPGLRKWTPQHLQEAFAGQSVLVGNYAMDFARFQQYCSRTMDEMPLYLFDKHAFDKAPQLADDFKVCASRRAGVGIAGTATASAAGGPALRPPL